MHTKSCATAVDVGDAIRTAAIASWCVSCGIYSIVFVHVAAAVECAGNFNNFAANSGASNSKAQPLMPQTSVAWDADWTLYRLTEA